MAGYLDELGKKASKTAKKAGDIFEAGAAYVDLGAQYRKREAKKKVDKADADAAAAPGIEMARRNAIPLMVDEEAIMAARKRALLKQSQRSGRESTMLSGGNTGGLGG